MVDTLLDSLWALGVREAFGVAGGAIVPLLRALYDSPLRSTSCRHESGALFAACEASLASARPVLAFATTGPGLSNTITGAIAARWEGAHVILISGATPAALRGRHPFQESSARTLPSDALYRSGGFFDAAWSLDHAAELPGILRQLAALLARPGGCVAHLALPIPVQQQPCTAPHLTQLPPALPNPALVDELVRALAMPFAIWVGFGARHHAEAVRRLVLRTGAPVMCTPRGKGIVPARTPGFLGVTGLGGHAEVAERLRASGAQRTLVLGTRLSEMSSSFKTALIPPRGMVHVDVDPSVPGAAFPDAHVLPVHAEIGALLEQLTPRLDPCGCVLVPRLPAPIVDQDLRAPVRPSRLMSELQAQALVDGDAVVFADVGNALAWCTRYLQPDEPGRYRQPGAFASMGHASAGALGAALAGERPVVAVVGDGAFLMQSELSTAVHAGAKICWVVLNDSRYGMVEQGLAALGQPPSDVTWRDVDFAALARSQGAKGVRVTHERELRGALEAALALDGPVVVDVVIDRRALPPFLDRITGLARRGQLDDE